MPTEEVSVRAYNAYMRKYGWMDGLIDGCIYMYLCRDVDIRNTYAILIGGLCTTSQEVDLGFVVEGEEAYLD